MRTLFLVIALLLPAAPAWAQLPTGDVAPEPFNIEGRWTGAYTRGDATQSVSAMIELVDDTTRITLRNDEWGYGNVRESTMEPVNGERVTFDSHYGTATMDVDSTYREMIGTVGDSEPRLTLHLKQSPPPPSHAAGTLEDITFESGGATIGATIVVPAGDRPHPGLVSVSGRGCGTRGGGVARLQWLARYGIGGIAYDDRGRGASDGNCKTSTLQTESLDAQAALAVLADHDAFDAQKLGFRSMSAGGWVAVHAAARSDLPVAFVVLEVGPATSVEQQQKDNARSIAVREPLSTADSTRLLRYVNLMFASEQPNAEVFEEMQDLLNTPGAERWADPFLVRDADIGDVPATAAGLDSLWVRRYAYNPAADLQQIDAPILAFFGENDSVVPAATNVPLFRQLMQEAGHADSRVVVIPEGGHGTGQGSRLRTLSTPRGRYDTHYWKFYRPAPDYQRVLLTFLREI